MTGVMTKDQKDIYLRMANETISGAKLNDYEFFRSMLASVVKYRHGKQAVKEIFPESGDIRKYLIVGDRMAPFIVPYVGLILRSWQNVGFFLAQDYIYAHKEQFSDLPLDFQEAAEFGTLMSDEDLQKLIQSYKP